MIDNLTALDGQTGFSTPRYLRGMRTTQLLFDAGRRLLRRASLDQVTVQDICTQANVTKGAFYSRFDGKESYFNALITLLLARLEANTAERIAELDSRDWELREVVALLARNIRLWAYRNEGVLRASLVERATLHDPIRHLNQEYLELVVPRLLRIHPLGPSPQLELRIRFAFQSLIGTLVFALINRSGAYALADKRLDEELTRQFYLYICYELDELQLGGVVGDSSAATCRAHDPDPRRAYVAPISRPRTPGGKS